jgi:hypothetical protein
MASMGYCGAPRQVEIQNLLSLAGYWSVNIAGEYAGTSAAFEDAVWKWQLADRQCSVAGMIYALPDGPMPMGAIPLSLADSRRTTVFASGEKIEAWEASLRELAAAVAGLDAAAEGFIVGDRPTARAR